MSRSPNEAPEEPLDLERLVIDSDYCREVMLRLRADSLSRRAQRAAGWSNRPPTSRKD